MQDNNIYAPPEADLHVAGDTLVSQVFYVVSILKFSILFFLTFGFYAVYWHYRNWKQYKLTHNDDCIPALRGFFSIFFTHTLFEAINRSLRTSHPALYWRFNQWATFVVITVLLERFGDQFSSRGMGAPFTDYLPLICFIVHGLLLIKVQRLINLTSNDPDGASNRRFTWLNYCWIAVAPLIFGWIVVDAFLSYDAS